LHHFSETILQIAIFGEKQKNFFFFGELYQNVKTCVAFDFCSKDLLSHKLSFFSKNIPFFCPFFALFDQNSKTILQMAILGEKQKNFFFFSNFIKILKPVWRLIFNQKTY
jgi:hypothetical protein